MFDERRTILRLFQIISHWLYMFYLSHFFYFNVTYIIFTTPFKMHMCLNASLLNWFIIKPLSVSQLQKPTLSLSEVVSMQIGSKLLDVCVHIIPVQELPNPNDFFWSMSLNTTKLSTFSLLAVLAGALFFKQFRYESTWKMLAYFQYKVKSLSPSVNRSKKVFTWFGKNTWKV